jgi:hypothetical protein
VGVQELPPMAIHSVCIEHSLLTLLCPGLDETPISVSDVTSTRKVQVRETSYSCYEDRNWLTIFMGETYTAKQCMKTLYDKDWSCGCLTFGELNNATDFKISLKIST